jgi:hypothetical protein
MAATETAGPSTTLRSGRDDNSVVAGIDATEQCPTPATELSSRPKWRDLLFLPFHLQLQLESPLSPCHPDRSEAQWRDLQCALRLSQILPGKGPGATNSQSNPYPQTRFRNAGGNTRLSHKIHPTESPNQLIWTPLAESSSFYETRGHDAFAQLKPCPSICIFFRRAEFPHRLFSSSQKPGEKQ